MLWIKWLLILPLQTIQHDTSAITTPKTSTFSRTALYLLCLIFSNESRRFQWQTALERTACDVFGKIWHLSSDMLISIDLSMYSSPMPSVSLRLISLLCSYADFNLIPLIIYVFTIKTLYYYYCSTTLFTASIPLLDLFLCICTHHFYASFQVHPLLLTWTCSSDLFIIVSKVRAQVLHNVDAH